MNIQLKHVVGGIVGWWVGSKFMHSSIISVILALVGVWVANRIQLARFKLNKDGSYQRVYPTTIKVISK